VGLEGCPYSKTNQQTTARIMQHPDRFFSTAHFDLLVPYPLTLLLIGGRFSKPTDKRCIHFVLRIGFLNTKQSDW
jgi:hypothetical protein